MKYLLVYTLLLIGLVAKAARIDPRPDFYQPQNAKSSNLDGEWFLQPAMASDTATGKTPTLTFYMAKNAFAGNTGCNDMKGAFFANGDTLVFNNQIVTTKMTCQGYNEKVFLDNLSSTTNYRIEDGFLLLLNNKTILSKWGRSKQTVVKEKA